MSKFIFSFLTILYSSTCLSQVGINTTDPQGIFHVHIDDNTNSNTKDIVLSDDGDLGIGTLTPKAKLDIVGSLYNPPNRFDNKNFILKSDANATGGWKDDKISKINRMTIIELGGTSYLTEALSHGMTYKSVIQNDLNLTVGARSVPLPIGTYVLILSFEFENYSPAIMCYFREGTSGINPIVYALFQSYGRIDNVAAIINIAEYPRSIQIAMITVAPRIPNILNYFDPKTINDQMPYHGTLKIIRLA